MESVKLNYIPMQLVAFIGTSSCCQELNGTFAEKEADSYTAYAHYLGLNVQRKLIHGVYMLTVFKRSCLHYLETPTEIVLHPNIATQLQAMLTRSNFIGQNSNVNISSYHHLAQKYTPIISPMDFPFKEKGPRTVTSLQGMECLSMLRPDLRSLLLHMVSDKRVIVLNSNYHDLITLVPSLLLTEAKCKQSVFRMLVVEVYELLATYNSDRAAAMWGEKLGKTIACQHNRLSCINGDSSITYTTYEYMLRILMGKSKLDSLQHITHIVLAEVHLQKANTHILLSELREILKYHINLKVILLSNASNNMLYIKYFNEGDILQLDRQPPGSNEEGLAEVIFVDDIRDLVEAESKPQENENMLLSLVAPKETAENLTNVARMDSCLDAYAATPSYAALYALLLMVRTENEDIDYQHSSTGVTALMLATSHCKVEHIELLLRNGADYLVRDNMGRTSKSVAYASGDIRCIKIFKNMSQSNTLYEDLNKAFIDLELLTDLILIVANNWAHGNILVFLPRYEYLLRVQYRLLRNRHLGQMAQTVTIHLLHERTTQAECEELANPVNSSMKIILSTSVAEQFTFNFPIAYVIDIGRYCYENFNHMKGHRQLKYKFISQDCMARRRDKANMEKYKYATYFCFLPIQLKTQLSLCDVAEFNYVPLERFCLTAKLLSRHAMISEFLQNTIDPPIFAKVHKSTVFLKKIGILDEMEDVTYLGIRVYDLPVDFQLGKMIIYAIMLQCLDPILTIATFLANFDPLKLPDVYETGEEYSQNILQQIRLNMKSKREQLSNGILSDHFMLLRLYQKWQNDSLDTPACHVKGLQDEYQFVLDGMLNLISAERTVLVTSLRSGRLVHVTGCFSMTTTNLKSGVWPFIKAALVAGLYPHILIHTEGSERLKSNIQQTLVAVHPEACLRSRQEQFISPINLASFPKNYIVYSKYYGLEKMIVISSCTVVNPLAVLLFCGPAQLYPRHISHEGFNQLDCQIHLDEWLWFSLKCEDAKLLLNTRQYFHHMLFAFLKNCNCSENIRKIQYIRNQNALLFNAIEKLLSQEITEPGVRQFRVLGARPKAAPHLSMGMQCVKHPILGANYGNLIQYTEIGYKFMAKKYFIVTIPDALKHNTGPANCVLPWLYTKVLHLINDVSNPANLTYLIIYQKTQSIFPFVFMVKINRTGCLEIQECFRNKISLTTVNNICVKEELEPPLLGTSSLTYVSSIVGAIILNLFAYKNSLLPVSEN